MNPSFGGRPATSGHPAERRRAGQPPRSPAPDSRARRAPRRGRQCSRRANGHELAQPGSGNQRCQRHAEQHACHPRQRTRCTLRVKMSPWSIPVIAGAQNARTSQVTGICRGLPDQRRNRRGSPRNRRRIVQRLHPPTPPPVRGAPGWRTQGIAQAPPGLIGRTTPCRRWRSLPRGERPTARCAEPWVSESRPPGSPGMGGPSCP